jgi:hypothetical protein
MCSSTIDFGFRIVDFGLKNCLHSSINATIHQSNTASLLTSIFILLLFLLANVEASRAQGCCTVGASSLGGFEGGVLREDALVVTINYQFNSLTRTYQERARIPDPQRRTASVSYFTLAGEYGLQPRLSLFASLPFADKSREITVNNALSRFDEMAKFGASGVGDAMVLIKYQLIAPRMLSPFELAIGGGASLPTGSFTKEHGNSQLSIDLQPGTGAAALIAWVYAMRSIPQNGILLAATARYRYAGTNFDGYRFGDEYIVVLRGEYSINENFGASLQVRSRFAMQDHANRRILSATGGTYHDLMPSVGYGDGPSRLVVFIQLPMYRNVRGIQLSTAYLLGVEYNYTFDFSSLGTSGEEEQN